jgi:anti-sigma factor RsiW
MDHRYIDDRSLAERYLDHSLPPPERGEFEAHLVDCQECTDRVLLAEMFHNRNGALKPKPAAEIVLQAVLPPETLRVRFVRLFSAWQIFLILSAAAALLVLLPTLAVLWLSKH